MARDPVLRNRGIALVARAAEAALGPAFVNDASNTAASVSFAVEGLYTVQLRLQEDRERTIAPLYAIVGLGNELIPFYSSAPGHGCELGPEFSAGVVGAGPDRVWAWMNGWTAERFGQAAADTLARAWRSHRDGLRDRVAPHWRTWLKNVRTVAESPQLPAFHAALGTERERHFGLVDFETLGDDAGETVVEILGFGSCAAAVFGCSHADDAELASLAALARESLRRARAPYAPN